MIPEERRARIINKLNEKKVCSINELVRDLEVSRITIQRDISILEKRGLIEKVHGGIKYKKDSFPRFETLFNARMDQNRDKKLEIAKKACGFVQDHSTIFIDSSSTCYFFAKELFMKDFLDLTIVTNSPAIQCEALNHPKHRIVSTGGLLNQHFGMFSGKWVIDFLQKINIHMAFISTAGVSQQLFLTTSNNELAEILRCVIEKTDEVNLLADSSKFFKSAMLNIAHIERCKRIISDTELRNRINNTPFEGTDKIEIII